MMNRAGSLAIAAMIAATGCSNCDQDETPDLPDIAVGDVNVDAGKTEDTRSEPVTECQPGPWTLASPDESVELTIELQELGGTADFPDGEALYYRAAFDDAPVVEWSPLGIEAGDHRWFETPCVVDARQEEVSQSYTMLTGKQSDRSVEGRELTLQLTSVEDAPLELVFRAHDDGFAHRYRLLTGEEVTVTDESTGFRFPADAQGWMAPYDIGGQAFGGSYEQTYRPREVGDPAPTGSSWAFPVLFQTTDHWMLLTEADLDGTYAATRLDGEPVDRVYRIRFPSENEGNGVGDVLPTATDPQTPWRVVIVGELSDVVESTLVDDLSRPSTVDDTSWIEPGRVAWSWFSQDTGTPDLQRAYIDFAARMGWEYVLIDAKWDQWENPDETVPMLVDEAAAGGVELLIWYNSGGDHNTNTSATPLDRMNDPEIRRAEMEKLADWGIAGIKVDFFTSDKQDRIRQYLGILEDAADHELLVNFHGATLPRGWQRTYPHLMTHEAVRGEEFYKFLGAPTTIDHVRYVFTRNVVGSMDYTPGAFDVPFEESGRTYGHSLALLVLFESGLQHYSGRADGELDAGYARLFESFPFAETFISEIPATWDETRLLSGGPDTHAVLARRNGTQWWLAGVNAEEAPAELSIPLDFLSGDATATCIETGAAPDSLAENTSDYAPSHAFELTVAPDDGFACRIAP